jgi:hypothetical protein
MALKRIFSLKNTNHLLKKPATFFFKKNKYLTYKSFKKLKLLFEIKHLDYLKAFSKIYMIGLGYKNFILENELFILIGDCNYLIFRIPENLKVFCRKNQIYILSNDIKKTGDFISMLKSIKKINFYKGKGVTEFKNFKFTKLKVGKKQRFA